MANTLSKTGATRVLSLFFAWDTPNQTPSFWWSYFKLLLPGGNFYAGPGVQHAAA